MTTDIFAFGLLSILLAILAYEEIKSYLTPKDDIVEYIDYEVE